VPSIPLQTPSATYTITIAPGLLSNLARYLARLTPGKPRRTFLITSPEIWALWSPAILSSFTNGRAKSSYQDPPTVLFLPAGESHKRLSTIDTLCEQLAQAGADRDTLLLALGGGVVGDMTGFLAAIYMRGIPFVQLPTTLLAQVDSSLGGKTGANLSAGKNLIGSFHHPLAVLADTDTLSTLPLPQLRSGLQESIKAGIIYDPKLFRYLEQNAATILDPQSPGHTAAITRVVAASVRVKADIVSKDERESGLRMILNFGHTLGHAIETATGYGTLIHGEAVAWGSIAATHLALARKIISSKDAARIEALILRYGPLPRFNAKAEGLVALTASDKKNRGGTLSFILPTTIGTVEIARDITHTELLAAAESMLTLMRQQPTITPAAAPQSTPGRPRKRKT
jgi:3-dehydroquinate synthase